MKITSPSPNVFIKVFWEFEGISPVHSRGRLTTCRLPAATIVFPKNAMPAPTRARNLPTVPAAPRKNAGALEAAKDVAAVMAEAMHA